jgi:penicillin V acylase-like amidase (Ntn superfamily)
VEILAAGNVADPIVAQYALYRYTITVREAVTGSEKAPFHTVGVASPDLQYKTDPIPRTRAATAIFEVVFGKLVVHYGLEHNVITNDPPYDEMLKLVKNFELSEPAWKLWQATQRMEGHEQIKSASLSNI